MLAFMVQAARARLKKHVSGRLAPLYLDYWGVKYGRGLLLPSLPHVYRRPGAEITIGSNVKIFNRMDENAAGIVHPTVLFTGRDGARIVIGDNVGLSGVLLYAATEIVIEDHASLGANVAVYDTDFHPIDPLARMDDVKAEIVSSPVRIGRNAWIGANALVLKGVTIGENTVIGAGSVVSRSVPDNCVAAGIPARVIKEL